MATITVSEYVFEALQEYTRLKANNPNARITEEGILRLADGRIEVEVDDDIAEWLAMMGPDAETAIRHLLLGGKA